MTRLWRTSHYENPHYTFVTDFCRANRFLVVCPASIRNQEQTVADPDGQTTKKMGYCLDCLLPTWTMSQ